MNNCEEGKEDSYSEAMNVPKTKFAKKIHLCIAYQRQQRGEKEKDEVRFTICCLEKFNNAISDKTRRKMEVIR